MASNFFSSDFAGLAPDFTLGSDPCPLQKTTTIGVAAHPSLSSTLRLEIMLVSYIEFFSAGIKSITFAHVKCAKVRP